MVWVDQVAPPSVVAITVEPPTAVQSEAVGHDTPDSPDTPLGMVWVDQVAPPSVVAITTVPPLESLPTAMQSVLVGHDTPATAGGAGLEYCTE